MIEKVQSWIETNDLSGIEVWKHTRRPGVWCAIPKASRVLDSVGGEGPSAAAAITDLMEKMGGTPVDTPPVENDDQFEDLLG